jgi:hypothetical protein
VPAALRPDRGGAPLRGAGRRAPSGARTDWLELLNCAARLGQPFAHADEALAALDALGAQDDGRRAGAAGRATRRGAWRWWPQATARCPSACWPRWLSRRWSRSSTRSSVCRA